MLRILFLGDVVGSAGLRALGRHLEALVGETGAHLVVANGENVAGGAGITAATARTVFDAGVTVITTGNHVWDRKEILGSLDRFPRLLRPANYPPGTPGTGWCVVEAAGTAVAVVSLAGRVFMEALDCPFQVADRVLAEVGRVPLALVDFHAEATSEKQALGWYLDGRVTAVLGTHTHVPTADERVLPGGTGYITDVGMTGVEDSVIGVPKEKAVSRFLTHVSRSLGAAKGEATVRGVLVEADPDTGRCLAVTRVRRGP